MRALIDVVHPADALFYKNLILDLERDGHETLVLARDKDVTHQLLEGYAIRYESRGKGGKKGYARLGLELTSRIASLVNLARRFRPDVILTRNPAGTLAGRIVGIPSIFDTDDGRSVGIYWSAAAPFATVITMPEGVNDDFRGKRVAYQGHKALAHLHPARFLPDPLIRDDLGLSRDDTYFLLRLVAMSAHHDRGEAGISDDDRRTLVDRLSQHGRVFMSSEGPLPRELEQYSLDVAPHRMPDVLANAAGLVGDSQSMAAEAAVLGVPSLFISSWARRKASFSRFESEFELVFEYHPSERREYLSKIDEIAATDRNVWQERRARLMAGKVDVTAWYRDLVEEVVTSGRGRRRKN